MSLYSDGHLFASIDWQRLRDRTPCRICGGDRLRADFTDSTRCHAPLPEAPTDLPADIAAVAQRLHREWNDENRAGSVYLQLMHQCQVRADAIRAAALKLRAEHPNHPDLDWLEGDHHD